MKDTLTHESTAALSRMLAAEKSHYTLQGEAHPLGASVQADGVNFSLYSKDATRVVLHLFSHAEHESRNTPLNWIPRCTSAATTGPSLSAISGTASTMCFRLTGRGSRKKACALTRKKC